MSDYEQGVDGAGGEVGARPGDDDEDVWGGSARSKNGTGDSAQQACISNRQRASSSSRVTAVSVS